MTGIRHETVLDEAARVVHGGRKTDYGHPLDNHGATASMVATYLSRKYRTGVLFDAEDVCWFNVLQKISRQANRPQRDNLVDATGYIANVEIILDERARRESLVGVHGQPEQGRTQDRIGPTSHSSEVAHE